jgi:hypothetical protein
MLSFKMAQDYISKSRSVIALYLPSGGSCSCSVGISCRSPGKHPVTRNGLKNATNDRSKLVEAGFNGGNQNIGILTGGDLMVLDIDAKSGGLITLDDLIKKYGALPNTPKVKTGGGGYHFYFRTPIGLTIKNRANVLPGLDIRGEGGYVVAPPSIHSSGKRYEWEVDMNTPLAECPNWLIDLITGPSPKQVVELNNFDFLANLDDRDLKNHPGAGEGERNTKLCQLAGIHLARGEDPSEVNALALDWGRRCRPPLDHHEIIRTVNALAAKEMSNQKQLTSLGAKYLLSHPELHPDALYGLAGEIVRFIEPETEADPVGILISLLTMAGNYVGRNCHFEVGATKHYPNLFTCLVGDSSKARKGTSLDWVLKLWDPQDPWMGRHASGLSSGEGLKDAVRDDLTETIPDPNNPGRFITEIVKSGISDKRLFVTESEFAQPLRVAKREGNTLSVVIRDAFDGKTMRTLTKNDPTTATGAHISIVGHITRDELVKELTSSDISNGFANRFLWICVQRKKLLPDGGKPLDLRPFEAKLRKNIRMVTGQLQRSKEAGEYWHHIYHEMAISRPGIWGNVTSRGEALTLRLSMIYAILLGSQTILLEHLKAAHALWKYADESARFIFGNRQQMGPMELKIIQAIEGQPGINRRELFQAVGGNIKVQKLNDILDALVQKGLILSKNESTGGRPAERWYLA